MGLEVYESARRHGIADQDIRHAVEYAIAMANVVKEPPRGVLYIGPDRAGNLLEVVVIEGDDGRSLAIHAMKKRKKYDYLLP